jgi:hypothetical protein
VTARPRKRDGRDLARKSRTGDGDIEVSHGPDPLLFRMHHSGFARVNPLGRWNIPA